MANPQAFEFWAPPAGQLDTSPLTVAGQGISAGVLAAGNAIGEGLAQAGAELGREQASEAVADAMEEIGSASNYKVEELDPSLEDPTLVTESGIPLDRMGRRQAILERAKGMGMPHELALQTAIQATTPIPRRVLLPDAAERIRGLKARAMVMARKAGMSPEEVQRGIELVQPEAFESLGEAHRSAMEMYGNIVAPPQVQQALLQSALAGKENDRQRQFTKEQAARDAAEERTTLSRRYGYDDIADQRAEKLARERMALEEEQRRAREDRNFDSQVKLLNMQHRLDMERLERASKLDTESRNAIEETKGALAQELAALKSTGGLTAAEMGTAQEFSLVVDESAVRGEAFQGVPLRTVASLVSDVGDYVRVADGGKLQTTDAFMQIGGVQSGSDLSTLVAKIGPDGEVKLTDTRADGGYTQAQLDKIAKSIFRSSVARDAVVVQQFYGATFESREKLSQLRGINEQAGRVGGIGLLDRARGLLMQVDEQGGVGTREEEIQRGASDGNPRNRSR